MRIVGLRRSGDYSSWEPSLTVLHSLECSDMAINAATIRVFERHKRFVLPLPRPLQQIIISCSLLNSTVVTIFSTESLPFLIVLCFILMCLSPIHAAYLLICYRNYGLQFSIQLFLLFFSGLCWSVYLMIWSMLICWYSVDLSSQSAIMAMVVVTSFALLCWSIGWSCYPLWFLLIHGHNSTTIIGLACLSKLSSYWAAIVDLQTQFN